MRNALLAFILVGLLYASPAAAQYRNSPHAIAVRGLFLNYDYPFSDTWRSSELTSGLEIEYARWLGGPFALALPLKVAKANYSTNEVGTAFDEGTYFGLDALLQFKGFHPNQFISPNLFVGWGVNHENIDVFNFALPLGGGLDFRLAEHTYLSTKAEYRFGLADRRDNIQVGIGVKMLVGPGAGSGRRGDSDGDGIKDEIDLCPSVAGPATTGGCPDSDGDGVADQNDQCPAEAGSVAVAGCPDRDGDGVADRVDGCIDQPGSPALQGCPDSDGDGVADKDDRCPTEKGLANNAGCPIRDSDGDGVVDDQDACPNAAGSQATQGCPDRDRDGVADKDDQCPEVPGAPINLGCPDTDADGVIDSQDPCPNTPGPAANRGCPEIAAKDRETLNFAARNLQFQTGSAIISPSSYVIMDQILDILQRYPDFVLVINGHTDSSGSEEANLRLSENRARACLDYLVARGIAEGRITAQGFGESRPLATNATPQGRAQNRRTEFVIAPRQ